MKGNSTKAISATFFARSIGLFLIYFSFAGLTVWAAPSNSAIEYIRSIDSDDLFGEEFYIAGNADLSGAGFPPGAATLIVLNQSSEGADFVIATPPKNKNGKVSRTPLAISDPVNIAFDSVSIGAKGYGLNRVFLWDTGSGKLTAIKAGPRNIMDPRKIKRFDMQAFGIANPQGMSIDPATGRLFVLDGSGTRIIAIQPAPGHNFAKAEASTIMLPEGLGKLRGLAFNPSDGHFYVLNPELQKVYALTTDAKLITALGFSGQQIGVPQGMVFAPSLDNTDHASIFHLYLFDIPRQERRSRRMGATGPLVTGQPQINRESQGKKSAFFQELPS